MKPLKALNLLPLLAICLANTAYACEFHGGFGGGSWAQFGHRSNPPMHSSALETEQSNIELKAPAMLNGKLDEKVELTINYNLITSEPNPLVQLSLEADNSAITTDDNIAVLSKKSGLHTFSLVPKTKGTYRILVTIRAINESDTSKQQKVIYIRVA